MTIFEDVLEDEELVMDSAEGPALVGKTLLGKPAQKRQSVYVPKEEAKHDLRPLGEIGQARKRASIAPTVRTDQAEEVKKEEPKHVNGVLKKDPRRRTIFVPADDTTMLTIHPGANTTDRLNDTFQLPSLAVQPLAPFQLRPDEQEQHFKPLRKARMSLAVAPKRIPLQQTEAKQNVPAVDRFGQNGGKENMPPGHAKKPADDSKPVYRVSTTIVNAVNTSRSRLFEPTASSHARQTVVAWRAVPVMQTGPHAQPFARPSIGAKPSTVRQTESQTHVRPVPKPRPNSVHKEVCVVQPRQEVLCRAQAKPSACKPTVAGSKLAQYPILAEDISQPQLYEESWLSHQEIAMTELINEIFHNAEPRCEAWRQPQKSVRERMLDIYQQPSVATLHKRLQASLMYGALSRPKDMALPLDPMADVGLRRQFLSLWLDNYEESALQAAAEVVVGRQVPRKAMSLPQPSSSSDNSLEPCKSRKALAAFLETFFVNVEDMQEPSDEAAELQDKDGRRWRKMILRSLLLTWLLDQAKSAGAVSGCLLKRTASIKSSTAMLHAISAMLIPSVGDLTRALRHFDFEVSYIQDPLDEVRYHISNIAIDLRDGIFFTRLIEILLFERHNIKQQSCDGEATLTIQMPDSTVLESTLFREDGSTYTRILSQHLKMPCLGRAQKVHNAQVALSALQSHAGRFASDVTAEDVVDGHREKTLSLLWSLVSQSGLAHLVDWKELHADLRRTGGKCASASDLDSHTGREVLLQAWATAHCARHEVRITNLTTSFADGKAYTAIMGSFDAYLHGSSSTRKAPASLESHLRALGCSTAFVRQLVSSNASIPSRSTTISNLAFLASRLLPLARRHNAAAIIQRRFRLRLFRRHTKQRVALLRLAYACATVVRTRNRLIDSAVILQRAWRRVMDARTEKLSDDVKAFQVCARGWLVRRRLGKASLVGHLKTGHSLRTMAGW